MLIKKKILNSELCVMLLLLAFFPPEYLCQNTIADLALNALELVGFLLLFSFFMTDIRKHLKKPFSILLVVLWAELLLSTLLSKNASLYQYMAIALPILGLCFLIGEVAIYGPYAGLKGIYIYFSVCALVNTATIFLFPHAMYANNRGLWVCWFLGEDNGGYTYYIIASTVAMIYTQYISKKITILSCLVWASAFVFVFYNDIATGIACQILWGVLVLGYQFGWFRKFLKARYVLYAIVGGFVAVVLLRSSILEPIVTALGRNITLTGRTVIWDKTLERIREKPVLGWGMYTGEDFDRIILNSGLLNAHNWLLMLTFYGGILALILYALAMVFSCKEASPCRRGPFYHCMVIGLIVLAVRSMVEVGHPQMMFMMLAMLAYSKEFVQGLESVQSKKKLVVKGVPQIRLIRRKEI